MACAMQYITNRRTAAVTAAVVVVVVQVLCREHTRIASWILAPFFSQLKPPTKTRPPSGHDTKTLSSLAAGDSVLFHICVMSQTQNAD